MQILKIKYESLLNSRIITLLKPKPIFFNEFQMYYLKKAVLNRSAKLDISEERF